MLCGPLALSTSANDVWLMRERLFDSTDAIILKVTALPSKTGIILQGWSTPASTSRPATSQKRMIATFEAAGLAMHPHDARR
jgi:hypothetical protein